MSAIALDGADAAADGACRHWHAVDSFAFAVVMWEVLTLREPHEGRFTREMWAHVLAGRRLEYTPEEAAAAPVGYVALMEEMWLAAPKHRPTFAAAFTRLQRMGPGGAELGAEPADPRAFSVSAPV